MGLIKNLILFVVLSQLGVAADYYFAASSAGSNNGSSCANAYSWTDATNGINTSGKWAAGNKLHLCGTITGSSGGSGVQSQGSGTSISPITIKFETGAILQAPHWGGNPFTSVSGAIVIQHNFITVDGGTNGIIQNTLNGSTGATCPGGSCSSKLASVGVYSSGSSITIKNLQISQMYVHIADDTGGANVVGIYTTGNNLIITNNLVRDAYYDIVSIFSSVTSAQISSNTLDHACHFIHIANQASSSSGSGYQIYSNNMGPNQTEWTIASKGCTSNTPVSTDSSSISNTVIYSNIIKSDLCSDWATDSTNESCVGLIYTTGGFSTLDIFNNLFVATNSGSNYQGFIVFNPVSPKTQTGLNILNNTFVMNNPTGAGVDDSWLNLSGSVSSISAKNNIIAHFTPSGEAYKTTAANFSALSSDNYNNYYDPGTYGKTSGTTYSTLTNWQALGFEANGLEGNPNFDANYKLQAGSSAIATGTNLTSSCTGILSPLCTDLGGTARPLSASWDIGAYQSGGTSATLSITPASVTFASQQVGIASPGVNITATNTGGTVISISSIVLTTGTQFNIASSTCGSTLAASAFCTVNVNFKPTSIGLKIDSLVFTDSATGSPQSVSLTGTGVTNIGQPQTQDVTAQNVTSGPPNYPGTSRSTASLGTLTAPITGSTPFNTTWHSTVNPTSNCYTLLADSNLTGIPTGGSSNQTIALTGGGNNTWSMGANDHMGSKNNTWWGISSSGSSKIFHLTTATVGGSTCVQNISPLAGGQGAGMQFGGAISFSTTDDNVAYHVPGTTGYHVITKEVITSPTTFTTTTAFDLANCPGGSHLQYGTGTTQLGISRGDTTFAIATSPGNQGFGHNVLVWEPGVGCYNWDTDTGDIWIPGDTTTASLHENACLSTTAGGTVNQGIHGTQLSGDGKTVQVSGACWVGYGGYAIGDSNLAYWEIGTNNVIGMKNTVMSTNTGITTGGSFHIEGHNSMGNSHALVNDNPTPNTRVINPLNSTNASTFTPLYTFSPILTEVHFGHPLVDTDDTYPWFGGTMGTVGTLWQSEILGIGPTPGTPLRVGPLWNSGANGVGCMNAIVANSQNGKMIVFLTDMLGTISTCVPVAVMLD